MAFIKSDMNSVVISSPAANSIRQALSKGALGFAAMLALCAFPFAVSDYVTFQASTIAIYSIAVLGLILLTGFTGQVSLGHGAFFALGAYAAAVMIVKGGLPYWLAVPAAAVVCALVGYVVGLVALRLRGPYLALATFALAVATPELLKHPSMERWTGGVQGLSLVKPAAPFGLPISADQWLYFLVVAVAAGVFLIARNIVRSRIGLALIALRDHRIAAASVGIAVSSYSIRAFGLSTMFAGLAGALSAITTQFVAPDSFHVFLSLGFLVGAVVGGLTSLSGAVIGAAFIVLVPNLADEVSKAATWAVYGASVLLIVYLFPSGIAAGLRRTATILRGQLARKPR